MIHAVNLGDNSETEINLEALRKTDLNNVWLEIVDPTEEELENGSDQIGLSKRFLELPKTDLIDVRLEDTFSIINFMIIDKIASAHKGQPVVFVFSRSFLITV